MPSEKIGGHRFYIETDFFYSPRTQIQLSSNTQEVSPDSWLPQKPIRPSLSLVMTTLLKRMLLMYMVTRPS